MKFGGLQKLTLLDYPGKVACTVFAAGCNLRCPFCHNRLVVAGGGDVWSEEEVLAFLSKRVNVLEGVCVTGGEPLLQEDAEEFLAKVKALGYKVKLDTNGTYPERLRSVVEKKLVDYVAMDVKNCRERYSATAGAAVDLFSVEQSIDFLRGGAVEHEFRTTVTRTFHTDSGLAQVARRLVGSRWYLQQFVSGEGLIDETVVGYSDGELRALYEKMLAVNPQTFLRGI